MTDSTSQRETGAGTLDAVLDRVDQLAERVDELKRENEQLRDRVVELEGENRALRDRLEDVDLKADVDLEALADDVERIDENVDAAFARIGRLSERIEEGELSAEADRSERALEETAGVEVETETSLERVVLLPEDVVDEQLSPNQRRARWVARGLDDYATHGGGSGHYHLRAGELGKVVRAGLEVDPHPQTVRRIMAILADLAGDSAELTKRHGEKVLVIDRDLVDRLGRIDRLRSEAHGAVRPARAQ